MILETVLPDLAGETVIVAAPGPSLTEDVSERCRESGLATIVVQDAWRRMPWALSLYGTDAAWWRVHGGCCGFLGEKWTTHDAGNDKTAIAREYGLRCVAGKSVGGFSTDPSVIHYGSNSGFQAVNLAILFGGARIVMVGFDMRGTHFFGSHPKPLRDPRSFPTFIRAFDEAARRLPPGVEIINATPGSALGCFPMVALDAALSSKVAA